MKSGRPDPLLGFRSRAPVRRHDHAPHMVWPLEKDGTCRQCWCAECGQEWELAVIVGDDGRKESKGWRPLRPDVDATF